MEEETRKLEEEIKDLNRRVDELLKWLIRNPMFKDQEEKEELRWI